MLEPSKKELSQNSAASQKRQKYNQVFGAAWSVSEQIRNPC